MRRRALLAFVACSAVTLSGCGSDTPIQPPPPPPALALSCPESLVQEASSPAGAEVQFNAPAPTGGVPPYSVSCEPSSSAMFPVGDTTVDCKASDSALAPAACAFMVTVRISRRLARSRFVAFGDSITAGEISPAGTFTIRQPFEDYPYKLEQLLREQYPAQDIQVVNRGFGGEDTAGGVRRLPAVIDEYRPEVILLQEGINRITRVSAGTIEDNLRKMILISKERGVDVIIATLMPVRRPYTNSRAGANDAIREVNERIARLAAEFDLGAPVDLHNLMVTDPGLIGMDGLHPTADGYSHIARAFSDAILFRYAERSETMLSR